MCKKLSWKIGEVIQRTGLSARALHFYEEKGLFGPVSRNAAGHRIYSQQDLIRLQQILNLKMLGISINDIANTLGNQPRPLVQQLEQQLQQLSSKREAMQKVEQRIKNLLLTLDTNSTSSDSLDELLFQTLESMTMYEKYFTQNEIDQMHHSDLGEEQDAEVTWNQWLEAIKSAFESGANPQSTKVQALMVQWQAIVFHLSGNDDSRRKTFNDLMHNEPQARRDHGIDDKLFEFMGLATQGHS